MSSGELLPGIGRPRIDVVNGTIGNGKVINRSVMGKNVTFCHVQGLWIIICFKSFGFGIFYILKFQMQKYFQYIRNGIPRFRYFVYVINLML